MFTSPLRCKALDNASIQGVRLPVAEVARQMLDAYPREVKVERGLLVRCIEACYDL